MYTMLTSLSLSRSLSLSLVLSHLCTHNIVCHAFIFYVPPPPFVLNPRATVAINTILCFTIYLSMGIGIDSLYVGIKTQKSICLKGAHASAKEIQNGRDLEEYKSYTSFFFIFTCHPIFFFHNFFFFYSCALLCARCYPCSLAYYGRDNCLDILFRRQLI